VTAEIAIINKGAITLATDSAVTLTVRGAQKIYNCADKLFELSDHDPIGIMVFNNLSFMGIPLEVAIKQFRAGRGDIRYDTIIEAATAFFRYLEEDLLPSKENQKQHARAIITGRLQEILRSFRYAITTEWDNGRKDPDYPVVFMRTVERTVIHLEALNAAEGFSSVTEAEMLDFHGDLFKEAIATTFEGLPLTDEHVLQLTKVCILTLTRDEYSALLTGVVFAGFGRLETLPVLMAFETDGIICNRLKKRETRRVVTTRDEIAGEIIPFAQREMVDRFLYGIDPEFENGIESYIDVAVRSVGNAILRALPRTKRATRERVESGIEKARQAASGYWKDHMLPAVKERFMREVQDMVYLMPKPELARLATELINLTSVKRKFSSGKDSVGGPIDVAVISKTDGFVWVRRKHYFKAELNPRYFRRKYGNHMGGGHAR
jgi:hypothetical protein